MLFSFCGNHVCWLLFLICFLSLLLQESSQVSFELFVLESHKHLARIEQIASADFVVAAPVGIAGESAVTGTDAPSLVLTCTVRVAVAVNLLAPQGEYQRLLAGFQSLRGQSSTLNQFRCTGELLHGNLTICNHLCQSAGFLFFFTVHNSLPPCAHSRAFMLSLPTDERSGNHSSITIITFSSQFVNYVNSV